LTKIIALSSHRGGVGKTTISLNLGYGLAESGNKVLLIDFDPQASLSKSFGFDDTQTKYDSIANLYFDDVNIADIIHSTYQDNLSIIPASLDLNAVESELLIDPFTVQVLHKHLMTIKNDYDYIFIDCAPMIGLLSKTALFAADEIYIPVLCRGTYVLRDLEHVAIAINVFNSYGEKQRHISGIILNECSDSIASSRTVIKEIKNVYGDFVFETAIPKNVDIYYAQEKLLPIQKYKKHSSGAVAYIGLAKEISLLNERKKDIPIKTLTKPTTKPKDSDTVTSQDSKVQIYLPQETIALLKEKGFNVSKYGRLAIINALKKDGFF
jgi:chromosome partitioning protein